MVVHGVGAAAVAGVVVEMALVAMATVRIDPV
jgi:hypothetical protein